MPAALECYVAVNGGRLLVESLWEALGDEARVLAVIAILEAICPHCRDRYRPCPCENDD